ncbi:hypothetical protein [Microbacterium sp. UBA3394]|uniref:hypothetical protein n=1 Tax=Microbacterium sp. UBA3394 TaxID=1946945 RepID=UPI00257DD948|nr:hypothetical protein [Microbacterium sp. UBA3394]|tara:strand:- start:1352 stop:2047 length:696 start_codon:yes stop_codon:yes gene_type:complete
MNRTLNVIRLQLVNRQTYVWVPLIVLTGAFVVTLAIYALLSSSGLPGPFYGGGAQAPLWYFLFVGIQALTMTFPFSQALSITRREFYLGTLATATITAILLATVFVIGGFLEDATGGWGMNGYFFQLTWIWEAGWWAAWLFYFAFTVLVFTIGFASATLYKRFGPLWVALVYTALALLLVGVMWVIGRLDAWGRVFTWFVEQGAVGLTLWGLLLTVVLAAGSFLTLRRATP